MSCERMNLIGYSLVCEVGGGGGGGGRAKNVAVHKYVSWVGGGGGEECVLRCHV